MTDPKANFEPAVHVWGDEDDLARLADFLCSLPSTGIPSTLNDIAGCKSNDGTILVVSITNNPSTLKPGRPHGAWDWQIAPDDILTYVDTIQGVSDSDRPCHNYLDQSRPGDPCVIVSKGEHPDSWGTKTHE